MYTNQLVKTYLKALDSMNLEEVLKLFSPGALVYSPMYGKMPARDFYSAYFAETTNADVALLGILGQSQGTTGQMITGYWAKFDWVLPTGVHAPFEVVVIMELDNQGLIEKFHIVMDTAFIRPVFEKEMGRLSAGPILE
jgi:hypothetical protein